MADDISNLLNQLPDIDLKLDIDSESRQQTPRHQQRVVVAMSGGVDSSLVAALVKRAGYDVVGMTLQLYDNGKALSRKGACCAGADIHDARQVAQQLDIPHYVLNYESRFKKNVMDGFVDDYLQGRTPIPCIRCNETVKFRDLLKEAKSLGALSLATGHYIETRYIKKETKPNIKKPTKPNIKKETKKPAKQNPKKDTQKNTNTNSAKGHWAMYRPKDEARDQSYFLFSTTKEQLCFLRFPLAEFNKDEIRSFAAHLGLLVADKPDSQDICFVPKGNYREVIKHLRPNAQLAGEIVDMEGNVVGTHQGVLNYTIGQRRGLGVQTGAPFYVVSINHKTRQVQIGPKTALQEKNIDVEHINWLGDMQNDMAIYARIRSTGIPKPAKLQWDTKATAKIIFDEPEYGVASGQACVFYDSDSPTGRVLGGGWIV